MKVCKNDRVQAYCLPTRVTASNCLHSYMTTMADSYMWMRSICFVGIQWRTKTSAFFVCVCVSCTANFFSCRQFVFSVESQFHCCQNLHFRGQFPCLVHFICKLYYYNYYMQAFTTGISKAVTKAVTERPLLVSSEQMKHFPQSTFYLFRLLPQLQALFNLWSGLYSKFYSTILCGQHWQTKPLDNMLLSHFNWYIIMHRLHMYHSCCF